MGRVSQVWAAVSLGVALSFLSGCSVSFDVKAEGEAVVPKGGIFSDFLNVTGLANFAAFDISQTQDFKNQGVDKEHLDSVKLKSLVLKVKAPSSGNFDFIDKIEFFAETEGKPKVRIAHKNPVPRGSTEFTLDLDDAELKDYVAAPSMSITTAATGRSPAQDTTIQVNVVFDVTASL